MSGDVSALLNAPPEGCHCDQLKGATCWVCDDAWQWTLAHVASDALIAIVAQPWTRVRLASGIIRHLCPCCGADMLEPPPYGVHALHGCAWFTAARALGIA